MIRPGRCVPGLILALALVVVPSVPARAQFLGGGFGYPGYGMGGYGYGGYGYGGYGYGGLGYRGAAFGYGFPGIGFSYGYPSYYGFGAYGTFTPLINAPTTFGYPVQGYGYGYYNPAFPYGLSPIAVRTAIGRATLNRALRNSGALTDYGRSGGVPYTGRGLTRSR